MAMSNRRTFLPLVIGLVGVVCTVAAGAQTVVLQLWNPGPAAGSIDSGAPNISCASLCSVVVPLGATVMLTAAPAPGNQVDGWDGACSGSGATCPLLMDGTKLVIASFKPVGDPLTVIHRFMPDATDFPPRRDSRLLAHAGYLYGVTSAGGRARRGKVFSELPDGSGRTVLHDFLGSPYDGSTPCGWLVDDGAALYGMTHSGGAYGYGTIYRVGLEGSDFTILHSFTGGNRDGANPDGSLIESGGVLFGMTSQVWSNSGYLGTIFKLNRDGSDFTVLHTFAGGVADGAVPYGSLTDVGGTLYGMTYFGGASNFGTVFRLGEDGGGFAVLHAFAGGAADGRYPVGSLLASGGVLYGTTGGGGPSDLGTVFRINADGSGFALLHSFAGGGSGGRGPYGSLIGAGETLYGTTPDYYDQSATIFQINTDGSGFGVLHAFAGDGSQGTSPGSLIVSGGELFGIAQEGGAGGLGTIYKVGRDGNGFAFQSFVATVSGGRHPYGSPIAVDGALYGMTAYGGAETGGNGAIFRINPDGSGFTVLHSFAGGATPYGSLIDLGGVLYGMTPAAVFKIDPDGSGFAVLHTFAGGATDGAFPYGSLVASDGVLYGMTSAGGTGECSIPIGDHQLGCGTIFRIEANGGGFALLYSFDGPVDPVGSLIVSGGVLYGMTTLGGIFRIDPDGSGYTTVHAFTGGTSDGQYASGSLVASADVFYGLTAAGGAGGVGTIFRMNRDGSGFALLHSFADGVGDGQSPCGSLIEEGGVLYGRTSGGGAHNAGTIFKIDDDGSGFAILDSFPAGSAPDPTSHSSSLALTAFAGGLYGVAPSLGLSGSGLLFRLDLNGSRVRRHLPRLWPAGSPGSAEH